jgi:hypothetical protein
MLSMSGWDYEGYLNGQIKEIEELKMKGNTDREILDMNRFCFETLKQCNLPISYLLPQAEGQVMDLQEWDTHTSCEHKWEYYDNTPFGNSDERDRVLMGLLYSCGFKHLIEILPQVSKEELFKAVSGYKNEE